MLVCVLKRLSFSFSLFALLVVFSALSVLAQDVIVSNDFEKGTEKWEARGERVSITSSKDQAAVGEKSLKVSGRSDFWQGAQLNVIKLLSPGKIYKFTASVKLGKSDKPDNLKMTIQRGAGGGESSYDNLAMVNANSDEWKTMSGNFKPSGSDGYILVYFEAEGKTTSFYLDDFKIELAGDGIPKQAGTILKNDFEDMTAQDWFPRGDGVQMFSSNAAGSQSLKVTSRTVNWHGVQLDVSPLMFKGRTYLISVSARLLKGQKSDDLKITMQQTPPKGDAKYVEITSPTTVTDGEWVTLSGQFTATTSDNNLTLYVEAANSTTSFFIDNFEIKMPETSK